MLGCKPAVPQAGRVLELRTRLTRNTGNHLPHIELPGALVAPLRVSELRGLVLIDVAPQDSQFDFVFSHGVSHGSHQTLVSPALKLFLCLRAIWSSHPQSIVIELHGHFDSLGNRSLSTEQLIQSIIL